MVYAFSADGTYLGQSQTTGADGTCVFDLAAGQNYKFRTAYGGYQFWSPESPPGMTAELVIPEDTTVHVYMGAQDLIGYVVYAFGSDGAYLGQSKTTDGVGICTFNLPEGETYKFRTAHEGYQFWSADTAPASLVALEIPEPTTVHVFQNATDLSGYLVYAFTAAGSYLSQSRTTGADGTCTFNLPAGQNYKFRTAHEGYQYWTTDTAPFLTVDLEIPSNTTVHVFKGADDLAGNTVYAFGADGTYTDQSKVTDSAGQCVFNLASGQNYKFRTAFDGYQFWSPETAPGLAVDLEVPTETSVHVYKGTEDLADYTVYAFTSDSTYLSQSRTTDAAGTCTFNLPAGQDYKFRTAHNGYQYWSAASAPFVTVPLPVPVDTTVVVTKDGQPLEGYVVYAFDADGTTYLDQSKTTDSDGQCVFNLPEGASYKFRTAYEGYHYWSDVTPGGTTATIELPTIAIPTDTVVHVFKGTEDLSGYVVYAFTADGTYTSMSKTTGADGTCSFNLDESQLYKFRTAHDGYQFWSPETATGTTVSLEIPMETTVHVYKGAEDLSAQLVYAFSGDGTYLSQSRTTDAVGTCTFNLPAGQTYKFRTAFDGYQFWSDVISPFGLVDLAIPVETTVHVFKGTEDLPDHCVYAFSSDQTYLGQSRLTGPAGTCAFNLPSGSQYMFRTAHGGYQFWSAASDLFVIVDLSIPIDTTVEVTLDGSPAPDYTVYAFAADGTYQGHSKTTRADGRCAFNLPAGTDYKFRTAHEGEQYWSAVVGVGGSISIHIGAGDTVPPMTVHDYPADGEWVNDDPVVINLAADDAGGSGVAATYYSINGGDACEGTMISISAEGEHTVEFWSVDVAGNQEPHQSIVVRTDYMAPTTTHDYLLPDSWTNQPPVVVTLAPDDGEGNSGVAGTYYVINDGEMMEGTTVTIDEDGAHTVEFWSVDVAGNEEGHKILTVRIDTVAPTLAYWVEPPANEHGWHNTDVMVHWQPNDELSGVQYYKPDTTVTREGVGAAAWGYVVDNAGNWSSEAATVNIDYTPPWARGVNVFRRWTTDRAYRSPHGWYNVPVTVQYLATDWLSGLDEHSWTPPSVSFSMEWAGYPVTQAVSDYAGNEVTFDWFQLNTDWTPPYLASLEISPQANSCGWHNETVTVTFTFADDLSGVPEPASVSKWVSDEGEDMPVTAAAQDRADNAGSGSTTVSIDKTSPEIVAFDVDPSSEEALVSVRYLDELSGIGVDSIMLLVDGMDVTVDATVTTSALDYMPAEPLSDGLHTFELRVCDLAGNCVSSEQSELIMGPDGDLDGDGFSNGLEWAIGTEPDDAGSSPTTMLEAMATPTAYYQRYPGPPGETLTSKTTENIGGWQAEDVLPRVPPHFVILDAGITMHFVPALHRPSDPPPPWGWGTFTYGPGTVETYPAPGWGLNGHIFFDVVFEDEAGWGYALGVQVLTVPQSEREDILKELKEHGPFWVESFGVGEFISAQNIDGDIGEGPFELSLSRYGTSCEGILSTEIRPLKTDLDLIVLGEHSGPSYTQEGPDSMELPAPEVGTPIMIVLKGRTPEVEREITLTSSNGAVVRFTDASDDGAISGDGTAVTWNTSSLSVSVTAVRGASPYNQEAQIVATVDDIVDRGDPRAAALEEYFVPEGTLDAVSGQPIPPVFVPLEGSSEAVTCSVGPVVIDIQAKRATQSQWQPSGTRIAAGGLPSSVHKADVKIEISPQLGPDEEVKVSLAGDGAGAEFRCWLFALPPVKSKLTVDGQTFTHGDESPLSLVSVPDTLTGTLVSSNKAESTMVVVEIPSLGLRRATSILFAPGDLEIDLPTDGMNPGQWYDVGINLALDGEPVPGHNVAAAVYKVYLYDGTVHTADGGRDGTTAVVLSDYAVLESGDYFEGTTGTSTPQATTKIKLISPEVKTVAVGVIDKSVIIDPE